MIDAMIDLIPWVLVNMIMLGAGTLLGRCLFGRRPSEAEAWHAEPSPERPTTTGRSRPLPTVLDDEYEAKLEEEQLDREVR